MISQITTMVNGTLLNFNKRYEDTLRVIFDQWPKLHLGLDALCNQKIFKGIYCFYTHLAISDMLSICLTSKCGLDFTIQIVLWDTTFKSNQYINVHKKCCNYIPSFTKSN